MISRFKFSFRQFLFKIRRVIGLEKSLVIQGDIRAHQIASKGKLETLADAEFSVFSQWGEDGILRWLTDRLPTANKTFVEFGVEDYREANTRYLMISQNWSGLVIDGSKSNINAIKSDDISYKYDIETTCAFIDKDNINQLISAAGFGNHVGILSVDIDGVDYWVLESIDCTADIIVVEYNDFFGPLPVSVPYDPSFVRLEKHPSGMYWGASLAAFTHVLKRKNYTLVGTNRVGTNAFYVADKHLPIVKKFLGNFEAWPCKMREARQSDGTLAYKNYSDLAHEVAHLPLVNVADNSSLTVAEATA